MNRKTILITGSTDGIGRQTAKQLAEQNHFIIIHGRNQNRVNETLEELYNITDKNNVSSCTADFSSLKQVKNMAEKINSYFDKIDVLINNAAEFKHERIITSDGFETTFQVNYLAHFLLTLKLNNLLKKTQNARVVNVSSMIHASDINFDNLQGQISYNGNSAYALSKLCNLLFTNKLADFYKKNNLNIITNSVHPGVVETKLLNAAWTGGGPLTEGSENLIYAATSEVINSLSPVYLENKRPMQSNPISYNKSVQEKLWKISEQMINKFL